MQNPNKQATNNVNDNDNNGKVSYGDTVTKEDGLEYDIYSKESKPDYDWSTYNKNQSWAWVV